jgi:hypothetical protein
MKAITLYQPWASLVAVGAKSFETRGWKTSHRGKLAIHAGMKPPSETLADVPAHNIIETARALGFVEPGAQHALRQLDRLPRGAVIAISNLTSCDEIRLHGGRGLSGASPGWLEWPEAPEGIYDPDERDIMFGDWSAGRYAWRLENVKELDVPVPARGKQGLWDWNETNNSEAR